MAAQIIFNGESIADVLKIEPAFPDEQNNNDETSEVPLALGRESFSFELEITPEMERILNYLWTVPEEWDLFVKQCIEKYWKTGV